MKNYISINDQKIELTDDQVEKIKGSFRLPDAKLADVPVGETFKIGEHEFIVLEHSGDTTAVISKDLIADDEKFGDTCNYVDSNVDKICNRFADELERIVGKENLCLHTVDLTADDGLKDFGSVKRSVALITTEQYRRFVYVLDKFKVSEYWWLATPFSTPTHGYKAAVKCVAPSGYIDYNYISSYGFGVRPFCILKSHIFVSK